MIMKFQKSVYKEMGSFFFLRFKKLSKRAAKHTSKKYPDFAKNCPNFGNNLPCLCASVG